MTEKKQELSSTAVQQADIIVNNSLIDGLTAQLEQKKRLGLSFPADYNPANALMGAYLTLKETNDKSGKCVLETCSQVSIANSLMDMVTMGLSMQKKQCYPIAYGGKLQCQVSTHGHKTMARRCGVKTFDSEVIYKGDTFKYHIENGRKAIDEHVQDILSADSTEIIGAYCVAALEDGSRVVEIMNKKQIENSWKKGYGYKPNAGTHAEFSDMMAKKTVTNRLCRQIVQQYGDSVVSDTFESRLGDEEIDTVREDVEYEIAQNANAQEFPVDDSEEVIIDGEAKEVADDRPDFLK